MVGKESLKKYECENIDDYYDLILESAVNGQIRQAKNYISEMSRQQKCDLLEWCINYIYLMPNREDSMMKHYNYVHRLTIETLK